MTGDQRVEKEGCSWPNCDLDMSKHDACHPRCFSLKEEGYDISQTIDGEWQTPTQENFYRACCDCGLVHKEEYRVHDGRIQYRVWRDKEETDLERCRTGRGPK